MLLQNLQLIGEQGFKDILILEGKIAAITNSSQRAVDDSLSIGCENAIGFPGLINSHDHLDFNLFAQTGNRIYNNYVEWGLDIHTANKEAIDKVLKVPENLRALWGLYKNLLCGVTTVVNHGKKLKITDDLISVLQNGASLHSVQLEKGWKQKLNKPFTEHKLFVIHVGEGTDSASHEEIDELIKWNIFKRKLVGVHGIAMDEEQVKHFEALVWCPVTNFFLMRKTAPIKTLKKTTKIIFGTDSTLSSGWNIWEHLSVAKKTAELGDNELFQSVSSTAAEVWGINSGSLEAGKDADIVIVRSMGNKTNLDVFFTTRPEDILLVIHHGHIRLLDATLLDQVQVDPHNFSKIKMNDTIKFVAGDLNGLIKKIKGYYPNVNFPISSSE